MNINGPSKTHLHQFGPLTSSPITPQKTGQWTLSDQTGSLTPPLLTAQGARQPPTARHPTPSGRGQTGDTARQMSGPATDRTPDPAGQPGRPAPHGAAEARCQSGRPRRASITTVCVTTRRAVARSETSRPWLQPSPPSSLHGNQGPLRAVGGVRSRM